MESACPTCGSKELEDAVLESMAVRLNRSSTLKKVFNVGGQVSCKVCLGCGAVFALRGNPDDFRKMLP
jgi:hypothetical protein